MSLLAAILFPWLGAVLLVAFRKHPRWRESLGFLNTLTLLATVIWIVYHNGWQFGPTYTLVTLGQNLTLALHAEPLGLLFALISSSLWTVTHLYCIGYMNANKEKHLTGFYVCFALALGSVMGIAFSANLLTLFIFYEVLTLSTYFLVAHKRDDKARRGGRIYLQILLLTSVGFLFPAIILTYTVFGHGDFMVGGLFADHPDLLHHLAIPFWIGLFMYGVGKAALMPFHKWLPNAMVAPTPVSALLHAVAVVKAGVFTVCKLSLYTFGVDFLQRSGGTQWLIYVAGFSILLSSVIALRQDNLKARLAYSTVSQLSYVIFACAIATPLAMLAAVLQILMHAFAKITLFFVAGNIYTAHHLTQISQCDGLARKMPWSYAAWLLGSLSIMGFPLAGGMWVKWNLFLGIGQSQQTWLYFVLLASTLLSVAYLLPVFLQGISAPTRLDKFTQQEQPILTYPKIEDAPILCLVATSITALGCVVLFFIGPWVASHLTVLIEP